MQATDTTSRYAALFSHDWQVNDLGNYLLVQDSTSAYFVERSDVSDWKLDQFDAQSEAGDPNAYTNLCQLIDGHRDEAVPDETLAAARELLGLGSGESVTYGW